MCVHTPHMTIKYLANIEYIHSVVGIFGSGTYLALHVKWTLHVVLFWHIYTKMLGLYTNITKWLCNISNVAAIFVQCCM